MAVVGDDERAARDASLAEALARIHAAAFAGRGWSGPEILALMNAPGVGLRLAHSEAGDRRAPAGFALDRVALDEAELLTLAVAPGARRAGLGRALVAAAEAGARAAGARRLFLEVAEDNAPARALYAGAGYREVGRRRAYYARPDGGRDDALILEKAL